MYRSLQAGQNRQYSVDTDFPTPASEEVIGPRKPKKFDMMADPHHNKNPYDTVHDTVREAPKAELLSQEKYIKMGRRHDPTQKTDRKAQTSKFERDNIEAGTDLYSAKIASKMKERPGEVNRHWVKTTTSQTDAKNAHIVAEKTGTISIVKRGVIVRQTKNAATSNSANGLTMMKIVKDTVGAADGTKYRINSDKKTYEAPRTYRAGKEIADPIQIEARQAEKMTVPTTHSTFATNTTVVNTESGSGSSALMEFGSNSKKEWQHNSNIGVGKSVSEYENAEAQAAGQIGTGFGSVGSGTGTGTDAGFMFENDNDQEAGTLHQFGASHVTAPLLSREAPYVTMAETETTTSTGSSNATVSAAAPVSVPKARHEQDSTTSSSAMYLENRWAGSGIGSGTRSEMVVDEDTKSRFGSNYRLGRLEDSGKVAAAAAAVAIPSVRIVTPETGLEGLWMDSSNTSRTNGRQSQFGKHSFADVPVTDQFNNINMHTMHQAQQQEQQQQQQQRAPVFHVTHDAEKDTDAPIVGVAAVRTSATGSLATRLSRIATDVVLPTRRFGAESLSGKKSIGISVVSAHRHLDDVIKRPVYGEHSMAPL